MNIITDLASLKSMVDYYLQQDAFAFDVETVGPRRGITVVNEVLWISFATNGRADVIPMGHPHGELLDEAMPLTGQGQKRVDAGLQARPSDYSRNKKLALKEYSPAPKQLYPAEVFEGLRPLLFNSDILTVGHNLVFDLTSVAKYYKGEVPSGPYFDTMVGSFVVDNRNKNKCGLDDCLKRELGYEMVKGVGKEVEAHSFLEVAKYAYLDAKYTFLLWKNLFPRISALNLDKVMKLEMEVLEVLCSMKLAGAPIDIDLLKVLHADLADQITKTKESIYAIAQTPFNMNSVPDKQFLLYGSKKDGGRGLKPKVLTPKGLDKDRAGKELSYSDYSVSAEALEHHRHEDELVNALLRYADLNKLQSTYVIPYLGGEVVRITGGKEKTEYKESILIDGKIHADFVQHGAETGRFSSRNPNLQNVPAPHTAHGKAIRNLFYAPDGHSLVVADYSQIEPRVIASFSNDPIMIDSYLNGGDIYTTVGETVGVDRKAGKVLVLSMAYGAGPDKIAQQIGCSPKEAKELLKEFSAKFPSIDSYRVRVVGTTRNGRPPVVTTLFGRRRYLPEILSRDPGIQRGAERQAFNTRIQGSAADIIKLAMVRAHALLPQGAKLILTIHDELVTMCPTALVDDASAAIQEAMEGINVLKVPLVADIKVVQRWGEAK
jgi:DNA polymerase I-like protein with 3'-5' exonuclease and polymerase domains